jgi:primosomal protein N' (replication factor Y)
MNDVVLLNGITGSGKTEIYMRLIESELSKGNQALFLVPEIGLTPQISFVLTDRFGDMVKIIHSGTSAKKRAEIWLGAKEGKVQLVVGTRSAIFTPFTSLGIVIVDEEHDQSYKQQTGLMYSARDLAVVKSKEHGSSLVLGSATPSFESLHNVNNKKYVSVEMKKRVFSTPPPKTKVIDLRIHQTNKGLAQPLINDIKTQLKKDKQVLIYLNRRGYAPLTMCSECGHIEECPKCDSSLVLYKQRMLLRCHHCAFEKKVSDSCNLCEAENIVIGKGTQKIEECLKEEFPKETVLRIDRDSTRSIKRREEVFNLARSGKAKILVGTQMLTKGHDFANLSMVAIVNADQGIFGSDFRSGERFAQHFFQASGRAGRRNERGLVVIQTNNPDNFLLKEIITKDYLSFYSNAILERRGRWPPYNGAVLIRAESINKKRVFNFLSKIAGFCNAIPNNTTIVLGPVSSPIERKLGKYRGQILLLDTNKKKLHNTINKVDLFLEKNVINKMIKWQLDIDPLDMS